EAEGVGAAAVDVLERGVSEAVVGRALLIVLQDVIGFADFLEPNLGGGIAVVAVGMMFFRKLAIRTFDRLRRGVTFDAQNFVIATLVHATLLTAIYDGSLPPVRKKASRS